jgi:hypothetical protein
MFNALYEKRNGQKIFGFYPVNGKKNILRTVKGLKLRSFTGPNGRGITVQEVNGNVRSFLESKFVVSLD